MNRRPALLRVGICLLCLLATEATAQLPPTLDPELNQEELLPQPLMRRLPQNDTAEGALAEAARRMQQSDFNEPLDWLQQIVELPEDAFVDGTAPSSLKRRAGDLLANLPPEGRSAYERRFGNQARTLLQQGERHQDQSALHEAAQRYFYTSGGARAAYRLALLEMDAGDVLSAARRLTALQSHPDARGWEPRLSLQAAACWLAAGDSERARESLRHVPWETRPHDPQTPQFPTSDAAFDWLSRTVRPAAAGTVTDRDWRGFRGNAQQNGSAALAVCAGDLAWRIPVLGAYDAYHPQRIEGLLGTLKTLEERFGGDAADRPMVLPTHVPVVVGDAVVFQSYGAVKAVSATTGSLRWPSVLVDESFRYLVDQSYVPEEAWYQPSLELVLAQRAWRDQTSAQISADAERVYAVGGLGAVGVINQVTSGVPTVARHPLSPLPDNRLAAYDLNGGRLLWEVGGPIGRTPTELSGVFFLGAPVAVGPDLFCLAEDRGEIRLLNLNPETGALRWAQSLYNPEFSVQVPANGDARRLAGLAPACAGGIVICPTGEGTVVAVDPQQKAVLWVRELHPPPASMAVNAANPFQQRQAPGGGMPLERLLDEPRWFDSVPLIADGYCLVTSSTTEMVYCLRLLDGSTVWSLPRGEALYLGGVAEGRVILVGTTQVQALGLADGKPLWREPTPIARPSGRGFRHGQYFVVPCTTGEITVVDLASGRIVVRAQLPKGLVAGNLVAAGGRVVSQTPSEVFAFQSLEELDRAIEQQLAANADDAAALALRGERRLQAGDEAAGLDDLRHSLAIANNPQIRHLITSTLVDGLRTDFATGRDAAAEIERLAQTPFEMRQFLRHYATGLLAAGNLDEAATQFLRLVDTLTPDAELLSIDTQHSARSEWWIRGQLAAVYAGHPGSAARIDADFARRLDAARAQNDLAALRWLVALFGRHPLAAAARLEVVRRMDSVREPIAVESHLLTLVEAQDPLIQGEAAARLVALYVEQGCPGDAREWIERLAGPLQDVACLDGQTGGQLAADWRAKPEVAQALGRPGLWPVEQTSVQTAHAPPAQVPQLPVPFIGARSGPLGDWSFFLDNDGRNLTAFDADGKLRWTLQVSLGGNLGNAPVRSISARGHLLMLVLSDHVRVVDGFHMGEGRADLFVGRLDETPVNAAFRIPPIPGMNAGFRGPGRSDALLRQPLGNTGPLTSDMLCYQQGSTLRAVNPVTGELLWLRENVDRGCEILADDECVILKSPASNELQVLSADDGRALVTRPFPADTVVERYGADWGRRLFVASAGTRSTQFSMYDPGTDKTEWQHAAAADTLWRPVRGSDIALLEPGGHFTILDVQTGAARLEAEVPLDPALADLTLVSDAERHYLITACEPDTLNSDLVRPVVGNETPVHGYVHALDARSGQVLWSQKVLGQMFDESQPAHWPVLVFMARVAKAQMQQTPDRPTRFSFLNLMQLPVVILDKRSGAVVFKEALRDPQGRLQWLSRAERGTLQYFLGSTELRLEFLKDIPPDAAETPPPDQPPEPTERPPPR